MKTTTPKGTDFQFAPQNKQKQLKHAVVYIFLTHFQWMAK